jgi:hypothetical protein
MTSCWNRRRRGWDCAPADRARCLRPARGKKRDIRCHRSRHLSTAGGSYRRPFPHPPGVECRCSNRAIPAGMPIRHLTGFQVGDSRHQDDRRTGQIHDQAAWHVHLDGELPYPRIRASRRILAFGRPEPGGELSSPSRRRRWRPGSPTAPPTSPASGEHRSECQSIASGLLRERVHARYAPK